MLGIGLTWPFFFASILGRFLSLELGGLKQDSDPHAEVKIDPTLADYPLKSTTFYIKKY